MTTAHEKTLNMPAIIEAVTMRLEIDCDSRMLELDFDSWNVATKADFVASIIADNIDDLDDDDVARMHTDAGIQLDEHSVVLWLANEMVIVWFGNDIDPNMDKVGEIACIAACSAPC